MNNHGLKSYDKYSVKYGRDGLPSGKEDGSPVLDELISSSVMLTPEDAKFLNAQWRQFCYYYVLVEQKPAFPKLESNGSIDAELLKKDLTLEKLMTFTDEQIDAVFGIMSKAAILDLVGIEIPKNKINLMKTPEVLLEAKLKINELKKQ